MDTRVTKKKLGLKERYAAMTRGLHWETTYQPMDKVFPYDSYEGIKIHDWDKWEDPFRLTMDAYWKYQAEKEKKLYAVIEAFAQNHGELGVTDARYINALKLFIQGVTPLEYYAHRGFAHAGRQFTGAGARVAAQMQAVDELRHFQTETHAISHYNKYYNGLHNANHWFDNLWYLSVPKSFFEDAYSGGPFEFLTAVSFSFEYVLTNLLFVPFMSGAAHNGDLSTVTFGFSAQSDESRHMTLGIECIKFMLEQDPANVPIVQRWMDKWFWRGYRLLTLVAMMQDYMLPKRVMSWKEAWEMYAESNGGALFADLARYGIRNPRAGIRHARARTISAIRHGPRSISMVMPQRFTPGFPAKMKWTGCHRNIPTASIATTALVWSTGPIRPRARKVAGTTRSCLCCARPVRFPCSLPSPAIPRKSLSAKPAIWARSITSAATTAARFSNKSQRNMCRHGCPCSKSIRAIAIRKTSTPHRPATARYARSSATTASRVVKTTAISQTAKTASTSRPGAAA